MPTGLDSVAGCQPGAILSPGAVWPGLGTSLIVTTWGRGVVPWQLEGAVPDTLVSGLPPGSGSERHAEGVLQARGRHCWWVACKNPCCVVNYVTGKVLSTVPGAGLRGTRLHLVRLPQPPLLQSTLLPDARPMRVPDSASAVGSGLGPYFCTLAGRGTTPATGS